MKGDIPKPVFFGIIVVIVAAIAGYIMFGGGQNGLTPEEQKIEDGRIKLSDDSTNRMLGGNAPTAGQDSGQMGGGPPQGGGGEAAARGNAGR